VLAKNAKVPEIKISGGDFETKIKHIYIFLGGKSETQMSSFSHTT
jgi:hypothetical protein